MADRIISADSHISLSHDQVKEHLASKHHDAYDNAVGQFAESMSMGAGQANSQWTRNPHRHPAAGRMKPPPPPTRPPVAVAPVAPVPPSGPRMLPRGARIADDENSSGDRSTRSTSS